MAHDLHETANGALPLVFLSLWLLFNQRLLVPIELALPLGLSLLLSALGLLLLVSESHFLVGGAGCLVPCLRGLGLGLTKLACIEILSL